MIIVDTALAKRAEEKRPIKVAMIGAGFQARGILLQVAQSVPGVQIVGIAARNVDQGLFAYAQAGLEAITAESENEINDAIRDGKFVVTPNAVALAQADDIECVLEVTGSTDYAARIILATIEAGKHTLHMNAEVDGTVGPILKVKADKAGVIYSFSDGDQPGVEANLLRVVKAMGVKPVLAGNIKGLHDPYRNPTTQAGFAEKYKQRPAMVASFADGTKVSFEQALVANAFDMRVAKRGMIGPDFSGGDPYAPKVPLEECLDVYKPYLGPDKPALVEYVVGASPPAGVFVLGWQEDPIQQHYYNYYKLGNGPLYVFYDPYHLCHMQVPISIGRVVLFNDAVISPDGAPKVGVVAIAKKDLSPGETIIDMGGYEVYGETENQTTINEENLLPIGIAMDCKLKRAVAKDQAITFDDVELPKGRVIDALYQEQIAYFSN